MLEDELVKQEKSGAASRYWRAVTGLSHFTSAQKYRYLRDRNLSVRCTTISVQLLFFCWDSVNSSQHSDRKSHFQNVMSSFYLVSSEPLSRQLLLL